MSQRKSKRMALRKQRTAPPWPLFFIAGGILLLGITAFTAWQRVNTPKAALEVTGAPRLKVDREQVDLGDVRLGQPVEVAFKLTNVGDQPLRFKEAPYVEVLEGC